MESDRLSIIKNYRNSPESEGLLKREINCYFSDYEKEENEQVLEIAFEYLSNKTEFESIEYRFLCWLSEFHSKNTSLNKPNIPNPKDIDRVDFENYFLKSQKRKSLYESLKKLIEIIKERIKMDNLEIIIGGSFTETGIFEPNDIDVVILTPPDSIHENYLYAANMVPDGVDVKILPIDYEINKFKAYSNLTHLGNKATNKNKERIKNNNFNKREIYKITI